jgi:hypothetical protein
MEKLKSTLVELRGNIKSRFSLLQNDLFWQIETR